VVVVVVVSPVVTWMVASIRMVTWVVVTWGLDILLTWGSEEVTELQWEEWEEARCKRPLEAGRLKRCWTNGSRQSERKTIPQQMPSGTSFGATVLIRTGSDPGDTILRSDLPPAVQQMKLFSTSGSKPRELKTLQQRIEFAMICVLLVLIQIDTGQKAVEVEAAASAAASVVVAVEAVDVVAGVEAEAEAEIEAVDHRAEAEATLTECWMTGCRQKETKTSGLPIPFVKIFAPAAYRQTKNALACARSVETSEGNWNQALTLSLILYMHLCSLQTSVDSFNLHVLYNISK